MGGMQRHVFRAADDLGALASIVTRTFGFIADGRELVEEEETSGAIRVRFPDRAEEGWPAFELVLPADALFDQAMSSVLTRGAMWRARSGIDEVVEGILGGLIQGEVRVKRRHGCTTLRVDRLALCIKVGEMRVAHPVSGRSRERPVQRWTTVLVTQKRDEEGLKRGLIARGRIWAGD